MAEAKKMLKYTIGMVNTQANRAIKQTAKYADQLNKKFKKFKQSNTILAKTTRLLTSWVTSTVSAGAAMYKFGSAMLKGAKDAESLETAFANINTLIDGPGGLTESTKKFIVEMSTAYGRSAQDNAKAYYDIISSGFTNQAEANQILEQANRGAVAGLTDVANSAKLATAVMNAYGKETISAKRIMDVAFQTVKSGVLTFKDLTAGMGEVASLGKATGTSFEEISAMLATITKKGIPASQAFTAIKGVLASLARKTTKEGREALEKLGLTWDVHTVKAKGFNQALLDLINGFKGNESALIKVIPELEGLKGALAIAGDQGKSFKKDIESMKNASGALDDSLKDVVDTTELRLNKAMQKSKENWRENTKHVSELKIAFYELSAEVAKFTKYIQNAIDLLKALGDMVTTNPFKHLYKSITTPNWKKRELAESDVIEDDILSKIEEQEKATKKTTKKSSDTQNLINQINKTNQRLQEYNQKTSQALQSTNAKNTDVLNKIAGDIKETKNAGITKQQGDKIINKLDEIKKTAIYDKQVLPDGTVILTDVAKKQFYDKWQGKTSWGQSWQNWVTERDRAKELGLNINKIIDDKYQERSTYNRTGTQKVTRQSGRQQKDYG